MIKTDNVTLNEIKISFTEKELSLFARLSGDFNPMHMDELFARKSPFGQRIVFGALSTIACLQLIGDKRFFRPSEIEAEFQNPVFVNKVYRAAVEEKNDNVLVINLYDGDSSCLRLLLKASKSMEESHCVAYPVPVCVSEMIQQPKDTEDEGLKAAYKNKSAYNVDPLLAEQFIQELGLSTETFSVDLMNLLCLCSYVIGMEFPGKRALFSKLHLELSGVTDNHSDQIYYSVTKEHYDEHYRMLDLAVEIGASGLLLAKGSLKAFVHKKLMPMSTKRTIKPFNGRTALVIGGSRGLGAEFVRELVLQGYQVFLNYYKSAEEAKNLQTELNHLADSAVHLMEGDAADAKCCERILHQIREQWGRLDLLVLNAFHPPLTHLSNEDYLIENMKLSEHPFEACKLLLSESEGQVVGISSIYVKGGPRDLVHYIEAKKNMEKHLIQLVQDYSRISFFIVRPPQLLTDMNNTPAGWLHAQPPSLIPEAVIRALGERTTCTGVQFIEKFDKTSRKINIASTFTAEPVQEGLMYWLKLWDWPYELRLTSYNQMIQDLFHLGSTLYVDDTELNILFVRFEDWYRYFTDEDDEGNYSGILTYSEEVLLFYEQYLNEFVSALHFYAQHFQGRTLLMICPSRANLLIHSQWRQLFNDLESRLLEMAGNLDGIEAMNTESSHDLYNVSSIDDAVGDALGHIPYTPEYFAFLSALIARYFFSRRKKSYKAIVLDCDNTLWGGIVGEEGHDGIVINEVYSAWQHKLIELSRKGYLLCLCSKNNPKDVLDVFANNPNMKLTMDDIVDYRISWQPKSAQLYELAEALNIGIDSIIFIDDSALEIAEVREHCPEVLALQWPTGELQAKQFVEHLWALDHHRPITSEDAIRTKLYKANQERLKMKQTSASYAEFIRNLHVSVTVEPVTETHLLRASQLTMRTNQFNTTGRRRTETELMELLEEKDVTIRKAEVEDRFGSYGFVGLMVLRTRALDIYIDSFLLSCRVLGRGVERTMLRELAKEAHSKGLPSIIIPFSSNGRNDAVLAFLEGMSKQCSSIERKELPGGSTEWIIPVDWLAYADPYSVVESVTDKKKQNQAQHSESLIVDVSQRNLEEILTFISIDLADQEGIYNQVHKQQQPFDYPAIGDVHTGGSNVRQMIEQVFQKHTRLSNIDFRRPIEEFQLESMKKIEISSELIRQFPQLSPTFLFEYGNLDQVIRHLEAVAVGNRVTGFQEVTAASTSGLDDIAIIGVNAKLPQSDSVHQFWENLIKGNSCITEIPSSRWAIDGFYSPDSSDSEKSHCKWGGFLSEIESFDHQFFNISAKEAEAMDPQQRLFLEVVWGLFEDAGYKPENIDPKTGVFVGVISTDFAQYLNQQAVNGKTPYRWGDAYQIANRISYFFNFKGPSLSLDTACSSSGTALHLACQSLMSKESRTAVVGGVNLILHPSRYIQYTQMGLLTSEDKCRPFSAEARGTIMGEGVGAILLKQLREAIQDGDQIYGIIKSSAINSGGKTNGFTVPNPRAHAELIKEAISKAGIEPGTVSYIETHGTGTIVGDPIEINGLAEGYSWNDPAHPTTCAIGSVKANIGHLESAAAIAGIIKIILQMKYQKRVPSLYASPLNPLLIGEGFTVQQSLETWTSVEGANPPLPRRAAISSFGAGGSNFHAILEEYSEKPILRTRTANRARSKLIILSARKEKTLRQMALRLRDHIQFERANQGITDTEAYLESLAFTLQEGRSSFNHRLAIICDSLDDLLVKLERYCNASDVGESIRYGECDHHLIEEWQGEAFEQKYFKSLFVKGNLSKLSFLWIKGVSINWIALYDDVKPVRVSLPTYPFDKRIFPLEKFTKPAVEQKLYTKIEAPALQSDHYQLTAGTGVGSFPFLMDHQVNGTIIVPGAFSLSLMMTALAKEYQQSKLRLSDITFRKAFLLQPADQCVTQIVFHKQDSLGTIEIHAKTGEVENGESVWILLTKAQVEDSVGDGRRSIDPLLIQARSAHRMTQEAFYEKGLSLGFAWGSQFQWIRELWLGENEVLAKLDYQSHAEESFVFPPSLLDACLQPYIFALEKHSQAMGITDTFIPFSIEELTMHLPMPAQFYSYISFQQIGEGHHDYFVIDVMLLDLKGIIIGEVKGLRLKRVRRLFLQQEQSNGLQYLYRPDWELTRPEQWEAAPKAMTESGSLWLETNPDGNLSPSICAIQKVLATNHHIVRHDSAELLNNENLARKLLSNAERIVIFCDGSPGKDWDENARTQYEQMYEQRILPLFRLLKVIAAQQDGGPQRITIVTENAQKLLVGEISSPVAHAVMGIAKVLNSEKSSMTIACVDFCAEELLAEDNDGSRIDRLCQSIAAGPVGDHLGYEEYAFRNDRIFRKRLIPFEPSILEKGKSLFKENAVYLIVGGSGGIGLELSEYLVKKWKSTLIWIGRKPQADIQQKMDSLQQLGGKVHYLQADANSIDDLAQAFEALRNRVSKIDGVIHAALVLRDATLAQMKETDFTEVFDTKALTMLNLLKHVDLKTLDFLLSFSSECSFRGSPAQANYVAACRYLDAFLLSLGEREQVPVRVMNWGYWGESGIVASEKYRKLLERQGLLPFSNTEGISIMESIVSMPYTQIIAVKTNKIYESKAGIATNRSSQPVPDDRALFMRTLAEEITSSTIVSDERSMAEYYEQLEEVLQTVPWYTEQILQQLTTTRFEDLKPHFQRYIEALRSLPSPDDVGHISLKKDENYTGPADAWRRMLDIALEHGPDIVREKTLAGDVIFPNGSNEIVEGIYKHNPLSEYFNQLMAELILRLVQRTVEQRRNSEPIRILEFGGGTGSTTKHVLRRLRKVSHQVEYMFTDVSPHFLFKAQQQFGEYGFVHYHLFNLNEDTEHLREKFGPFDIILGTNAIHISRDLSATLLNLRKALTPYGHLLINELTYNHGALPVTFGLLTGWWDYKDAELRLKNSPLLSLVQWQRLLETHGFRYTTAFDYVKPLQHRTQLQHVFVCENNGDVYRRTQEEARYEARSAKLVVHKKDEFSPHAASSHLAVQQKDSQPAEAKPMIRLSPAPGSQQLQETLISLLRQLLLIPEDEQVRSGTGFQDLGVDSLLAVQFRDLLSTEIGLKLPSTIIYDYPTIQLLSDYIMGRQQIAVGAAFAEQSVKSVAYIETESLTEKVNAMSEEEAERELLKELQNL
ncbi:SDR family NAD(P)-dependent oxidoreductase [Paenibacillus sp. S150]|uniref:SDR family NAD(P)-dependent oxidoreductase n=1 Tax=Paenibacillus sp. S150 TaxID=2749826 RepID=UPI001C598EAC|nr:SDR family NAD(P)-dependent oxidoreductase [Paenibacillus sp. S150]MBW4084439.1 SDR family NAD(P)-dependent oxidoreductase [Paenibacillus sp. S150]